MKTCTEGDAKSAVKVFEVWWFYVYLHVVILITSKAIESRCLFSYFRMSHLEGRNC